MTPRRKKIIAIVLSSLVGLLLVLGIAAVWVSQTAWFRDHVRERIVHAVEASTGGQVEIGEFQFDWRHLRVQIRQFVLHGTESADQAPLFEARSITAELKLLALARRRMLDIASLDVLEPKANLIVDAAGRTNIPEPKIPHTANQTGLQTLVDLAIGRFTIQNGSIHLADQQIPLSVEGENLAVHLSYEMIGKQYRGQISMNPVVGQYAENQRTDVHLNLGVVLGKDRIELANATLGTPNSTIQISGAVENMASPRFAVKGTGHIDLAEMKRVLGESFPISVPNGSPRFADAEIDASSNSRRIDIAAARLAIGKSSIDASGTFRNMKLEDASIQFRAELALGELGRMLDPMLEAGGELEVGGSARMNGVSDYHVDASLAGSALALRRGKVDVSNVRLNSKVVADSSRIALDPFTIQLGPGQIRGAATLEDFARYHVRGNLSRLAIQPLLKNVTTRDVEYAGTLSGPIDVEGNFKLSNSVKATARLNIVRAPQGLRGVPVAGSVNVAYDGPADTVNVGNSYIALPSSRLDFSGSLGQEIDVHLASRNLEDFRPAVNLMSNAPARLPTQLDAGGSARFDAKIVGRLSAPNILGHLAAIRFRVEQRHFDQLTADVAASNTRIAVDHASLQRDSLVAAFQGAVGLDHWAIKPGAPVLASASIQNGSVLDVLAFAGQSERPVTGDLSLEAHVSGTVSDPQGTLSFQVSKGMAYGESLDLVQGQLTYGGRKVSIPDLHIESGPARVNVNATFEHPPGVFSNGTLRTHVDTNQVELAKLDRLQKQPPQLNGNLQLTLDADLALGETNGQSHLRLVTINGTVAGSGLSRQGRSLGNFNARIQTSAGKVQFRLASNFAGSTIDATGETDLGRNYETAANLNIQNLPIQDALAVAGKGDLAASGTLSARGSVSGTITDPHVNLDASLAKAVVQHQAIDKFQGHLSYSNVMMELDNALIQTGTSQISLSGSFSHPSHDFSNGDLTLKAQGTQIQLAQVAYLQEWKPGVAGTLQLSVDTSAKLHPAGAPMRVSFSTLTARASLTGIRAQNRDLGGLTASIEGASSKIEGNLESNLAQSSIKASFKAELTGDLPASGQVMFSDVHYANWAALFPAATTQPNFDAVFAGSANVSGPILKPENLNGNAELTEAVLFARPSNTTVGRTPEKPGVDIALKNDGPVTLSVGQAGIQIKQARWTGPASQVSVNGNVALRPLALNLNLNADADLALLHTIQDDVSSEGHVQVNASVKGPLKAPAINGRLELRDAAYQTSDMPNGISKATGVIVFGGTTATIQSLTAETGGGKLTVSGTISRFGGQTGYNLAVRANRVQIRTNSGASVGLNADLRMNGTQKARLLSGTVTIRDVGFNPQSDIGTILADTANPPQAPAPPGSFLAGTRVDLSIRTSPTVSFQSSYTTDLEADADLTLRGTLANPGMLGRVNVSSGNVLFFGTKYTLDSGSVSFFNPARIDPILDLNLQTTVRGVQVTLSVTGPVHDMNLAYQSDPPLQFSEIVGLLATGRMPTSDPVLLAQQPATPPQTFQQMGESAILNKAVANPVSGQLKRVFGVTELKIDPTFTSGSELPQARLTLQQNITKQLTFTYITDLTSTDSQILRAEWALNQRWSAVATRQENGLVGIDLFYKRRFR
jgi:translocation and assembly module TamB